MAHAPSGEAIAMIEQSIVWGEDLPTWVAVLAAGAAALFVILCAVEVERHRRSSSSARGGQQRWVVASGALAALLCCLAVLRPATVRAKATLLGAKVIVLTDQGRHMTLPADGQRRAERTREVVLQLDRKFHGSRISGYGFGEVELKPLTTVGTAPGDQILSEQSDVLAAFQKLSAGQDEKPAAIVVISDGQWQRPEVSAPIDAYGLPAALKGAVVHTVDVGGRALRDASVLSVHSSGTAIAHQPLALAINVFCASELKCDTVPVVVREHKKGVAPELLARGEASFRGESTARVNLDVTVERAGSRILEIVIEPPTGDEVQENNQRYLTLEVIRDRLRLLHVAGRPTYDVRALRQWLKSDSSVDLVSFFILRTDRDEPNTEDESELALIPFPVDELFTEHLSSFDAIILEDIDAERYNLARHLENLARYVEQGGGLILVGGPSSFSGGAYARSPLERVLPVSLVGSPHPFDTVDFVPKVTEAGRGARLLEPLRTALAEVELPSMPGANTLGPAKPKAVVLWEHPSRTALPLKTGGAPGAMPVLAVSEVGDGRVVAMGVDGSHRLAWGSVGLKTGGRGYGAFWDGLLGWVMRDERFEAVRATTEGDCVVGRPTRVRATLASPSSGQVTLEVERLEGTKGATISRTSAVTGAKSVSFDLDQLTDGGYSGLVRLGREPAARFDFACERGGRGWADPRAYPDRLDKLARANQGRAVSYRDVDKLPRPEASRVTTYRQVTAWVSPWVWALGASLAFAGHWLLRRLAGLS